ncbi:MAG: biosynthetic arginine decarboxylase [Gammaproteobacteria bacterium]|jgi:arginine decarboxylase
MKDWTIADAKSTYNIDQWSGGYFDVNDRGNLTINPGRQQQMPHIELRALVEHIKSNNLSLPCLIRFPHILRDRVDHLYTAFTKAMASAQYHGQYKPVYPIKVNQEQSVVTELINTDQPVGLEAGSKPELMAVLALAGSQNSVIVCNGYKDREYIRLALIGKALGHKIYIVLEKPSEVAIVINEARAMNIEPTLGIRLRLDSIAGGKWQNTGGEKSKFGFSSSQALEALQKLRENQLLDCLELLHFHLGSQITDIEDIHSGITECARYYVELKSAGAERLDTIDVGGGLGIDYEGTRSRSYFSMNYSIQDYATTITNCLGQICDQQHCPHPHVITESGRAMAAHHAVLIVEVIETEHMVGVAREPADHPQSSVIESLQQCRTDLQSGNCTVTESYHTAIRIMDRVKQQFNEGQLGLTEKATCEQYFYELCDMLRTRLNSDRKSHRDMLDELNEKLADKYFCNFSLFQSLPDIWAINQIFPIAPLSRLTEKPDKRGTIHDITCDSDGRIDSYVDADGIEASLPLHRINPGEPYYLGIFLVGAYQEILGDMHNLFGDTNSVNVDLTNDSYELNKPRHGDSVGYVLRHVHYNTDEFIATYKNKLAAVELPESQRDAHLMELKAGLTGYTYLEE